KASSKVAQGSGSRPGYMSRQAASEFAPGSPWKAILLVGMSLDFLRNGCSGGTSAESAQERLNRPPVTLPRKVRNAFKNPSPATLSEWQKVSLGNALICVATAKQKT